MKKTLITCVSIIALQPALAMAAEQTQAFIQHNFVANKAAYKSGGWPR